MADKPNNENKPPVDRTPNRPMAERPTVHDKPQPGLDKETFGAECKPRPAPVADRKPERTADRPVVQDKPQQRTVPAGLDKETFGAEFKQSESSKARMSAAVERTTQTTTTETTKRKTKSAEKRGERK